MSESKHTHTDSFQGYAILCDKEINNHFESKHYSESFFQKDLHAEQRHKSRLKGFDPPVR